MLMHGSSLPCMSVQLFPLRDAPWPDWSVLLSIWLHCCIPEIFFLSLFVVLKGRVLHEWVYSCQSIRPGESLCSCQTTLRVPQARQSKDVAICPNFVVSKIVHSCTKFRWFCVDARNTELKLFTVGNLKTLMRLQQARAQMAQLSADLYANRSTGQRSTPSMNDNMGFGFL